MSTYILSSDEKSRAAHALSLEYVRQTVARNAKPEEYAIAYTGAYRDIMKEFEIESKPSKKNYYDD